MPDDIRTGQAVSQTERKSGSKSGRGDPITLTLARFAPSTPGSSARGRASPAQRERFTEAAQLLLRLPRSCSISMNRLMKFRYRLSAS
jgi:hypothetical protein